MKKNANEIMMLQYRIKRYQAMGNGTMCQLLNGKLQKLLAKQVTMYGRDCKFYLHLKNHIDCSGTRKEATSFLFKLHSSKIPSEGHSALFQQNNRSPK